MTQIAFVTLFLGLTAGLQNVEVALSGPVAAVVFELDGREVVRRSAPPWAAAVDFGDALVPHELAARALDAGGAELARAQQLVNTPRAFAEAELLLVGDPRRPVGARLTWQSVTGRAARQPTAELDGAPIAITADGRISLPTLDPAVPHLLGAEVRFADGLSARRDVAFGGALGDQAQSELTALALRLPPKAVPPPLAELGRWVERDGRPLPVVAAERGGAQLIVVRAPGAQPLVQHLAPRNTPFARDGLAPRASGLAGLQALRYDLELRKDDRLRFLWPAPHAAAGRAQLFDVSVDHGRDDGGLFFLLAAIADPPATSAPRLADAVAVAGLQALGSGRPRAVLLVLADEPADRSQSTPALVRGYLDAVRVPLFVWRLRPEFGKAWGPGAEATSLSAMRRAFAALELELRRQLVVWVDGLHAPQRLSLSAQGRAAGAELATSAANP